MKALFEKLKSEIQGTKGLVSYAKEQFLPNGKELSEMAWKPVFPKNEISAEELKNNFDYYLCRLLDIEYEIYLECENRCVQGIFDLVSEKDIAKRFPTVNEVIQSSMKIVQDDSRDKHEKLVELSGLMRPIYKFIEQSLGQGRMSRAGGSPQYHLERLLKLLDYVDEFEAQVTFNGTVDFLFPSLEAWNKDRRRCVIVSVKRTLRERYKQVFEELDISGGLTVYLLITETYEESKNDVTETKVERINQQNIYLVVREEIKQKKFAEYNNVIGFNDFINNELPNRRIQWQSLVEKEQN